LSVCKDENGRVLVQEWASKDLADAESREDSKTVLMEFKKK
jgi:hypothetical protein